MRQIKSREKEGIIEGLKKREREGRERVRERETGEQTW